jgi:hypothetical protein
MIGMTSRGQYLNPRFVIAATRKAGRRVLSRQGAYVRGIARRKIRRAPRGVTRDVHGRFQTGNERVSSPPGTPPYTHTGALKKSIIFGVGEDSVVIGPTYSEIGRIGHTHEFGGVEPAKRSRKRKNNWVLEIGGHGPVAIKNGKPVFAKLRTAGQVARARQLAKEIPVGMTQGKPRRRYPRRSFMGPALDEARPTLSKFWANSIKSAG